VGYKKIYILAQQRHEHGAAPGDKAGVLRLLANDATDFSCLDFSLHLV
jgi:hypothetical protein